MFQGFYNLASGMLTQNRNLNVISNNMSNTATPGYKADTMTSTTFEQEMYYRNGNVDRRGNQIGNINMIRVPGETVTDFTQGAIKPTGGNLDFAIEGNGFFKVDTGNGMTYTRNGSFCVDDEGCLALQGVGKVQGLGGEIFIDTDQLSFDSVGGIYDNEGELIDNIEIVDFDDYTTMTKQAGGVFTTGAQELEVAPLVHNQAVEMSNAEPMKAMSDMMATQRTFQSASQMLKIYDQIMGKATTEIARF